MSTRSLVACTTVSDFFTSWTKTLLGPAANQSTAKRRTGRVSDMSKFVTPDGSTVSFAGSSVWIGGRGGALHRVDGSLGPRRWATEGWIYCQSPEFSTASGEEAGPSGVVDANLSLSFLDEVTALAAGHRPCEVRQPIEAKRFQDCWSKDSDAQFEAWAVIDQTLHAQRLDEFGRKRTQVMQLQDLPSGSMFRARAGSYLFVGGRCFLWSTRGYAAEFPFLALDTVEVLTPKATLDAIRAGYEPDIHESVLALL